MGGKPVMGEDRVPPKGASPHLVTTKVPILGTPLPKAPGSNNTHVDVSIEARMVIGSAKTEHRTGDEPIIGLDPGLRLRQYELIREVGRGGMGQVFLARDVKLARRVAIKFLATKSRDLTNRFLIEARTTAAVNHENIVVIHEVDEMQGIPHMVLEYLDGSSLRELMRGRAYAPSRVVELVVPVVRAVARAHAAGIVHRDLKPENIIITVDGAIKVLDFGIAKALVDPKAPQRRIEVGDLVNMYETSATSSTLIGTPQYMSPEQFGLDAIDHRTDIWAIGIIMFELLTGRHPLAPYTPTSLIAHAAELEEPVPPIGSIVMDLPERLERIVDRCLSKKKAGRYPDAAALLADLEALLPGRFGRKLREDECPYPGLTAFQEEDADRFFGRSRDVSRMVTRLRDQALVGIAGPSGIGKSSFVRAGVVPALKASGEPWEAYILRPGRQPLASLANVLAPLVKSASLDGAKDKPGSLFEQEDIVDRLTHEPGFLGTLLRERAARKNARILLFIDQFEELYTLVANAEERRIFTSCLAGAADDGTSPVRIICSIRSDFLDRVGENRAFLDELMRGLHFLQPLGRPELTEALTRPLDSLGYDFETDELVEKMLDDLTATPGALPLLQFAAARLWESRDRRNKLLTKAAHDAMGGISGALATHADEVLAALPAASHKLVRTVLQRLVTPERTRAIVDLSELRALSSEPRDVERVVDHLVQARLLVVQSVGDTDGGSVEIVHESLITSWPTLRRWLDESQEDAVYLAQLRTAAKQWDQKGRPPGLLWRGEAATEARMWNARYKGDLPPLERAYLDAVISLATRATRIKRAVVVGIMVFLSLLVAAAAVALIQIRNAEQEARAQADRAEKASVHANTEMQRALKAEATIKQQLQQIKDEQAAKEQAQQEAAAKGVEVEMTKEQLQDALLQAKAESQKAKDALAKAQQAVASEKRTREEAQRLYEQEKARAERLQQQSKKIINTDLK
jgi:serine/threonine protein kinase